MAFEEWYLLVDRNDTWMVVEEEMDDYRVHWDHSLNRMDYNLLSRVKMMMLTLRHCPVEPNLYHEVVMVVEDSMLTN